jgi:23S rRNA pseudouridine2605 synthase
MPDKKPVRKEKRKPYTGRENKPDRILHNPEKNQALIRLNKFIANAGICSRREADKLIGSGVITVNGKPVSELGIKISPEDRVQYDGQNIRTEKKYYVLLNKPKGYLTTTDDPFDRKTVMFLVKNACHERIYPVGRLDRETTGVLLLTNDGDLAKKLTHPKYRITKIYHVVLDKNLKAGDMKKIAEGIELEDGFIRPDAIAYAQGATDKKEIGIEIHSGKNRVIRRIFETVGYRVARLDRVSFAGLTKKDVPRGKWRYLNDKEIGFLKMK